MFPKIWLCVCVFALTIRYASWIYVASYRSRIVNYSLLWSVLPHFLYVSHKRPRVMKVSMSSFMVSVAFFNQNWNWRQDFSTNPQYRISWKSVPMEPRFTCDRLTEKHDETNILFSKHICYKHLKTRIAL